MKRLSFILAELVIVLAARSQAGYIPREGDLLFQVAGVSEFSSAIAGATAMRDSLKFVHVAMVALEYGVPYVIEATDGKGVVATTLESFLASSHCLNGRPGVVVMRVGIDFSAGDAVKRARSHLGEDYDWAFLPDNGKMYCSELIYESYRRRDGTHLFTARPMNFRDAEGNMPEFWTSLFKKQGMSVPEGIPGTNPNDISKEPFLTEVYRFF